MPLVINTNVQAMNAQRNLGVTGAKMGKALEKLSSGLRINRAADDAAGLAISEKMRAQVRGLGQGARNAQDGISMIQTAEGAMNEVHGILQRMRELSVQAGNSTLSTADRTAVGEEMLTLKNEVNNIASRTKFNGLALLTGALSTTTTDGAAGTLIKGLALATTTTADVASLDVSKLKAATTYTFAKVDADTATLSDGTTTVSIDIADATIGADGSLTISFSGAHQASVTVVGAAAKTTTDILTDLHNKTIITGALSNVFSFGSTTVTTKIGDATLTKQ